MTRSQTERLLLFYCMAKINYAKEIKYARRGQGGDRRLRLFYSPFDSLQANQLRQ